MTSLNPTELEELVFKLLKGIKILEVDKDKIVQGIAGLTQNQKEITHILRKLQRRVDILSKENYE